MRFNMMLCSSIGVLGLWSCGQDTQTPSGLLAKAAAESAPTANFADEPLIVGGSDVGAHDVVAKSTVSLLQPNGWQFCTGSLIAKRFVVTAAHCLKDYRDSELFIGFGVKAETALAQRKSWRKAAKYTVNEDFDFSALLEEHPGRPPNDIALVALEEDAPHGFVPIHMLAAHDKLKIGEHLVLAGFGLTNAEAGSTGSSGTLRKVTVKLAQVDEAANEIEYSSTAGRSACMGDSGGPAFVKRHGQLRLLGITSRGPAGCQGGGIYTDVRHFQTWIHRLEHASRPAA